MTETQLKEHVESMNHKINTGKYEFIREVFEEIDRLISENNLPQGSIDFRIADIDVRDTVSDEKKVLVLRKPEVFILSEDELITYHTQLKDDGNHQQERSIFRTNLSAFGWSGEIGWAAVKDRQGSVVSKTYIMDVIGTIIFSDGNYTLHLTGENCEHMQLIREMNDLMFYKLIDIIKETTEPYEEKVYMYAVFDEAGNEYYRSKKITLEEIERVF